MQTLSELISLKNKTAIVTGGAMGIGAGIVWRLAEAGANVVIADIAVETGEALAQQVKEAGFGAIFVKTDITVDSEIKNASAEAVKVFGSLDILVNNAGIFPSVPLREMTVETFEKIISVNLKSVFTFTKVATEIMIKQGKGGKIINITSIDALHPSMVGLSVYDASKHGLWGFTKNTALEYAPFNIQINAIAPGGIVTPGSGIGENATPEMQQIMQKFISKIPMKRMGEPDDIGRVALFLASDLASYMTGTQVVVDGGVLLS